MRRALAWTRAAATVRVGAPSDASRLLFVPTDRCSIGRAGAEFRQPEISRTPCLPPARRHVIPHVPLAPRPPLHIAGA